MVSPAQLADIRARIAAFNHFAARGPHERSQELIDLEAVLIDLDHLRAGIKRIADGYGGDVQSLARNLLEGKV